MTLPGFSKLVTSPSGVRYLDHCLLRVSDESKLGIANSECLVSFSECIAVRQWANIEISPLFYVEGDPVSK